MKTLSAKIIARHTNFIKDANENMIEVIKESAKKSLEERDPSGTQYAIAKLELELISKL